LSSEIEARARARWNRLTKPPGSLGRLEDLVVRYCGIRGDVDPSLARRAMFLFCGDHGVVEEGVAAFPPEITQAMVRNFCHGGAAISVLCRQFNIQPVVVDVGVKGEPYPGVLHERIAEGTCNFTRGPAMTRAQAELAIKTGRRLAREAGSRFDIVAAGEMGIGNTTAAAALLSVFSDRDPAETCGRGTGVDDAGLARKIDAVRRGIEVNRPDPRDAVGALAAIGGFEIGAIAGLMLGAMDVRLPVVLDGFICCSAALVARAIDPRVMESALFSHRSAERGHALMLEELGAEPYLDLDMRLGEGTGAALLIGLLDAALRLYREMATFDDLERMR
jgi:nicotinate-nucleotide--dimethylbenzimidazole phosphoribosyltransferase